ncbi:hypothetical protein [Alicyclobacillus fructus]|uniref:hypothetical protein n=1 Tax=Alicyclobacillus fructus TaxID=2816082 RepID=UPI001A90C6C8|nr:hypothetical protein [Alicyclobacillus fructus]
MQTMGNTENENVEEKEDSTERKESHVAQILAKTRNTTKSTFDYITGARLAQTMNEFTETYRDIVVGLGDHVMEQEGRMKAQEERSSRMEEMITRHEESIRRLSSLLSSHEQHIAALSNNHGAFEARLDVPHEKDRYARKERLFQIGLVCALILSTLSLTAELISWITQ